MEDFYKKDFNQKINLKKDRQKSDIFREVGNFLWEIVKVFVLALVIIIPIKMFIFQPFKVEGASMYPNFYNSDYLIVDELGYKNDFGFFSIEPFRDLERGDVVVFRPTSARRPYYIKRIVGLPGEKIYVGNDQVLLYDEEHPEGFKLDESAYLKEDVQTCIEYSGLICSGKIYQLENDEYFLMGDNRKESYDSRKLGPFNEDRIVGKVILRMWPFGRMNIF